MAKRSATRRLPGGIGLGLFVLVVWTFFPSLRNSFIDYDDALFVTSNPVVQSGLSWGNAQWAFGTPVAANWHPVTLLSHMLDCQLYGLQPWGHHLTNVLLHALNTVLLFFLFRRLTGAVWPCAVLAALFGLHPLRVESVAWVSERKDVLSTFFFLLTLLAYHSYATSAGKRVPAERFGVPNAKSRPSQPGSTQHATRNPQPVPSLLPRRACCYLLALLLFAVGLMCKPMLVTLPFVLLLLDFWPLRRLELNPSRSNAGTLLRLVGEKAPFFILAAVCSVITFRVQEETGAVVSSLSLGGRLENALVAYVRYLGKVFWPADLSVFYPHPQHWPFWQVAGSAAVLAAITAAALLLARQRPYLALGWLWFGGTLVPVIGLVQVGAQSMADRYSYLPAIGLLVMLVWGAAELAARGRRRVSLLAVATAAALALAIALTRGQLSYWQNGETLFKHALAVTDSNRLAKHNLGVIYYNLGVGLACREAFAEAVPYYQKAIQLDSRKEDAHRGLGYALLRTRRFDEAIQEYQEVLRLKPDDPEAHNNLGNALVRSGQIEQAAQHCLEALRLKPNYPEAHYNLGVILAGWRQYAEAAAHLKEALRLNPAHTEASQALARVLAAQARAASATEQQRDKPK